MLCVERMTPMKPSQDGLSGHEYFPRSYNFSCSFLPTTSPMIIRHGLYGCDLG
jgi:hypothetical protein